MTDQPNNFILDVDGVLTTGQFFYSSEGKVFKVFGPDDNDALKLISKFMNVHFVTGDSKGFDISKKRISDDMSFKLSLVSTTKRIHWIEENYDLEKTVYMGDGIFDHYVMRSVFYSIAPANANITAKQYADHTTQRSGGDRAVAEACVHLINKFWGGYDPERPLDASVKFSGIY